MAQFNLTDTVDSSTVFLVKRSDSEDYLEPKLNFRFVVECD